MLVISLDEYCDYIKEIQINYNSILLHSNARKASNTLKKFARLYCNSMISVAALIYLYIIFSDYMKAIDIPRRSLEDYMGAFWYYIWFPCLAILLYCMFVLVSILLYISLHFILQYYVVSEFLKIELEHMGSVEDELSQNNIHKTLKVGIQCHLKITRYVRLYP